jgi:hypothetical protein
MLKFVTRTLRARRHSVAARRSAKPYLHLEALEDRLALSWPGVPPSSITPPSNAGTVTLDAQNDAQGNASITQNEIDYYSFVAPTSGSYRLSTLTPSSSLDTVLGVFSSSGRRLAYNDDISRSNRDSQLTVNLTAENRYYFGITNYTDTPGGSYTWQVDGPSATTPPPPEPTEGFDIVLRVSGLTPSQQQVFDRAVARWEQIIIGDVPSATYRGVAVDDVLIDAEAEPIDGPGGVLGEAGPNAFRSGSRLPIHGSMAFDSADLTRLESNDQLYAVVLHEIGHILGIGTIWQSLELLTGAGTTTPRFLGAQATAEYNALFGTTGTSVPVEGRPSPAGSRDSHWRESVFGNELLSPFVNRTSNPLSRVTVAALADLGYTVNLSAADAYTPPRSSGGGGGTGGGGGPSFVQGESATSPRTQIDAVALFLADRRSNVLSSQPVLEALAVRPDAAREAEGRRQKAEGRRQKAEGSPVKGGPASALPTALRPLPAACCLLPAACSPVPPGAELQTRGESRPNTSGQPAHSADPAAISQPVDGTPSKTAPEKKVPERASFSEAEEDRVQSGLRRPEFGATILLLLQVWQRRVLDWRQSTSNRLSAGLGRSFRGWNSDREEEVST